MATKYTGDVKFKGGLDVMAAKPLDSRAVVEKKEDLLTIAAAYEGMAVVVNEESTIYILKDLSKAASLEGWKKATSESAGTGGSGDVDLSDYATKQDVNNLSISIGNLPNEARVAEMITGAVNGKFVVITESDFKKMEKHDSETFYFIV